MGPPSIDPVIILTITDDTTQRIPFEVELNVHVLPLWIEKIFA